MACLILVSFLLPFAEAFTCEKPHALSVTPGPNQLCECSPGWFGPTCEICTNDQACGILLHDTDGVCRNTTFTAIKESFGWCAISSEDVTNLIHGDGFVQIYYSANGTFFFDFVKRRDDGKFLSLFRCNSLTTKVTEDPALGQVKYSSPDLRCGMTCEIGSDPTCTKGLEGIASQVGTKGGSSIVCDPKARTCDVHENTLDTFLGGVKTTGCYMSECALKGETVAVSVGSFTNISRQPPAQQTSYILGTSLLAVALVVLAIASSYYFRSGRYVQSYAKAAHLLEGKATGAKEDFVGVVAGGKEMERRTEGGTVGGEGPAEAGVPGGAVAVGVGLATTAAAAAAAGAGAGAAGAGAGAAGAGGLSGLPAAPLAAGGKGAGAAGAGHRGHPVVWEGMTYTVGSKKVLKGVSGFALPGELLAIMGPSGSGKTTMIDILSMKTKRGTVGGRLFYGEGGKEFGKDGKEDERIRESVGFVDQEDNLMGTLTVFESVLFSAFLRLPDGMSMDRKTKRVLAVLQDLRIVHIADSLIGIKGRRGISGGEKRRVMVAMEMVKVPAILFLDEPTSGKKKKKREKKIETGGEGVYVYVSVCAFPLSPPFPLLHVYLGGKLNLLLPFLAHPLSISSPPPLSLPRP